VAPKSLKDLVKKTLNGFGLELHRLSGSALYNAVGLRAMGIQTVLDIGANTGQFAQYIRSVLPHARLFCFEPLAIPFSKLETLANRDSSMCAFNFALGESEGTAEMFEHLDHSPSSSLLRSTEVTHRLYPKTRRQARLTVAVKTLDVAVKEFGIRLEPELLIKLDVQGYEDRVIRGGKETFSRATACLCEVSFDSLYSTQCTPLDLWNLLGEFGFVYKGNLDQTYADDGHVIFADCLFARS
jgi:FkbM family methyltransferase